jgi:quinol monooxygenase YgiN
MSECRVVAHYHFKKGMEREGLKFIENEVLKKAKERGCHDIEIWQNEKNPLHFVAVGIWSSAQKAQEFQSEYTHVEKMLMKFLTEMPKRDFYRVEQRWAEREKRAA